MSTLRIYAEALLLFAFAVALQVMAVFKLLRVFRFSTSRVWHAGHHHRRTTIHVEMTRLVRWSMMRTLEAALLVACVSVWYQRALRHGLWGAGQKRTEQQLAEGSEELEKILLEVGWHRVLRV